MNTSVRNLSLIALLLVIGVLVAAYFAFYTFLPEYNLSKQQYANAMSENARLKTAVDSVQTFLSDFKSQQANIAKVNLALPTANPDMANFISSLSDLSTQSSVTLSNFQPVNTTSNEEGVAANTIKSQEIDFSASSTYPAFRDFLLRLEQHLRLVDIFHITLSGAGSGQNASGLQYQVKLKTYYQK